MFFETNPAQILDLMERPAFWVSGGQIAHVNQGAAARMLCAGEPLAPLVASGRTELEAFQSGCLYLTLLVSGQSLDACVTPLGGGLLFTLEPEQDDPQLRTLALAAQALRQPLSQILSVSGGLFSALEQQPELSGQLSSLNRSYHQLLRLVGNMSDAATAGVARMELRDVSAVVQEILEHAQLLCQAAGTALTYDLYPAALYSLVDSQKLERAIYNLLANALTFAPKGSPIHVTLKRRGPQIYFTMTSACDPGLELSPTMFRRFAREPGLGDIREGLGLGLTLVRSVASSHRGALLFEQPQATILRTTLSLPIRQDSGPLRAPALRLDYAGGWDHGLIELSGVLPPELYAPDQT